MVNYPTDYDDNSTLYLVADNVDDVLAVHHNALKDAIIAVQTALGKTGDFNFVTDAEMTTHEGLTGAHHLKDHDNTEHTTNYEAANANIQSHVASPVSDAHHAKYTTAETEAVITAELVDGQSIDNAIDALLSTHNSATAVHGVTQVADNDDLHAEVHTMGSHSDDDTYNIVTSGTYTLGAAAEDLNLGGFDLYGVAEIRGSPDANHKIVFDPVADSIYMHPGDEAADKYIIFRSTGVTSEDPAIYPSETWYGHLGLSSNMWQKIYVQTIQLNAGVAVNDIDIVMAGSPSDSQLLTAQGIKEYVDANTPLLQDLSPQLGGDLDVNSKVINLNDTGIADHIAVGTVIEIMASATGVTLGDAVYVNSSGTLDRADADVVTSMPAIGLAVETKTSALCRVLISGYFRDDTWSWTDGGQAGLIYISTTGTAGNTMIQTPPSGAGDQVQVIGHAVSTNYIIVMPSPVLVEVN